MKDYKKILEEVLEMGTAKCQDQSQSCRIRSSHWITCWRCIEDKIKNDLALDNKTEDSLMGSSTTHLESKNGRTGPCIYGIKDAPSHRFCDSACAHCGAPKLWHGTTEEIKFFISDVEKHSLLDNKTENK